MRFLKFLIFSNIYVALPVTFLALETYWMLHFPIDFLAVGFIYFSTLFLYSFHRYLGVMNTKANEFITERMIWSKKHLQLVLSITIFSGLMAVAIFLLLEHQPILILIPCTIIALGYSVPIWIQHGELIRLRDINGIKIILISIVVAAITTLIPFEEQLTTTTITILLGRLFFIIGITIPFDIRDVDLDVKHKLKTIPSVYGEAKSTTIAIIAMLIFIGITIIFQGNTSLKLALIASGLVAIPVIKMVRKDKSDLFFAFGIEGLMIIQALFVGIANYL